MIVLHVYKNQDNMKVFSKLKLFENLSHYLKQPVNGINIQYNDNGKPLVDGLFFSISHCRNTLVQIFSSETEIGIDIECINPSRNWLKLAKRYFHAQEYQHLNSLPTVQACQLFYRLWTAKEAVCKARGGRLWYYLADNYLTENQHIASTIHDMNIHFINKMPEFSLCLASSDIIETHKIEYFHHV